jgi:hypothetical protein
MLVRFLVLIVVFEVRFELCIDTGLPDDLCYLLQNGLNVRTVNYVGLSGKSHTEYSTFYKIIDRTDVGEKECKQVCWGVLLENDQFGVREGNARITLRWSVGIYEYSHMKNGK